MKIVSLILTVFLFAGCSNDSKKNQKQQSQVAFSAYCDNELALINDNLSNWKIPIDSIKSMDDYFDQCLIQKQQEYAKAYLSVSPSVLDSMQKYGDNKDTLEIIFENVNPHPKVFPYLTIDSIDVSLMQLLRSSGAGYSGYSDDILWIHYYNEKSYSEQNWIDSISNFFSDFKPKEKYPNYEWNKLQGPMINLTLEDNLFNNIEFVIKDIIAGYLEAQNLNSLQIFKKNLCELTKNEVIELKKKYPLKIRLVKYGT